MDRRFKATIATILSAAILFFLGAVGGSGGDGFSTLGPAPAIAVVGIVFGVSSYVAITGRYGPKSIPEAAGAVTLIYGGAALGFTGFRFWLVDTEVLFLVLGLGTIPAAAGAAFSKGSRTDEVVFGSLLLSVSLGSALYLGGNLLDRIFLHTWAMAPGFVLAFVYTSRFSQSGVEQTPE